MRWSWSWLLLFVWVGCVSSQPVVGEDGSADGGVDVADAGAGAAEDGGTDLPDGGSDADAGMHAHDDGGMHAGMDAGSADAGSSHAQLIAERPYRMVVPQGHDSTQPAPLVVLFHGYSASGQAQDSYFKLSELAEVEGFLLATPDGTLDSSLKRFWNATDACCNFENRDVDDVAYFHAIVADVRSQHAVDPKRIFAIGHSNGGFMSHRLACDAASTLAGIVSLAGAGWADTSECHPSEPVAVLQVHGTLDGTILYNGGAIFGRAYPSAPTTVSDWAMRNGCDATTTSGTSKDLVSTLAGAETTVAIHHGCTGGAAQLWSIQGGGHIPGFNSSWAGEIYDFLMANPKP